MDLAEVRALLDYDPQTGVFTWKVGRGGMRKGARVGSLDRHGYLKANVCGRTVRLHRLAIFYVTGEWPPADVDHENRNRADNRFNNLRPATRSQNRANSPAMRTSKSGIKGVAFVPKIQKWRAVITCGGITHRLGSFPTAEAAAEAHRAKAAELFGGFARGA